MLGCYAYKIFLQMLNCVMITIRDFIQEVAMYMTMCTLKL